MKIYTPEKIEEYIQSVIKHPELIHGCLKDHFLSKDTIKYEFGDMNDDDLLFCIRMLIKYEILPNRDEKILLEQIRDKDFISHDRLTPWKLDEVDSIDSKTGKTALWCAETKFRLSNLWGFTKSEYFHTLLFDRKTLEVLWADLGNYDDTTYKNRDYRFISHNHNVYNVCYIQANLWFFQNPCKEKKLLGTDNDSLDLFVNNELEESIDNGHGFIMDIEFAKICDMEKCIDSKFFANGPNWKHGNYTMYKGKTATYIKDIYNKDGRIHIVIENNTFENSKCITLIIDFDKDIVINESNNQTADIEQYELEI